ncbi:hypothetical protein BZA05DRAFT_467780 [Tricharina praecox]|uniref:uncharacterized protein n=1 Tax=Tricharina praecox TaxID=43433 RepID=UPI00221E5D95|nr:uncharacterized protein BZA05DRAFT_467780 [Tricharina praecox]KAI5854253.1 hypothetical protein BZA05DRAFT_467780 [Tricharina praecox]
MTENPTASTSPGLPQLPSNATSTQTPDDAGGEIRCICECNEDDGYTVCCDKCGTWQHVACMQLSEDDIPSNYLCNNCSPRAVETRRARELQKQRRRDEKINRRKRSATTSHKKKEVHQPGGHNGQNGVTVGKTIYGTEKTAIVKLPSPREPQAPPTTTAPAVSRKRNQRASHSAGNSHQAGSITGSPSPFPDRNADAESDTDTDKYRYEFIDIGTGQNKLAALWVDNLLDKMGDCACVDRNQCLLAKIKECGRIDSAVPKRPATNGNGNGNGKKQRIKRNPSTESNRSKEPTPDVQQGNNNEGDPDRKVKPGSRDLTPVHQQDIAVDSATMTRREERKFKEVLSRIEKQVQEEQVPQPPKRRKRNSATSDLNTAGDGAVARSASPGSGDTWGAEERKTKSHKGESPVTSPGSVGREVSVVDAGSGRSPGSSTGSIGHKRRNNAGSPAPSTGSTKVRRKVKTKAVRLNYVDSSVQTEPDDELPWWKLAVPMTPPRPPRLPLRKRLMQSLLKDREEAAFASAATTSEDDKKRKLDCFAADTTVPLPVPKVQKTAEKEVARPSTGVMGSPVASVPIPISTPTLAPISAPVPAPAPSPALVPALVQELPDAPPIVVETAKSPQSTVCSPAPVSDLTKPVRPRAKSPRQPSPNGLGPTDKVRVNGVKPAGLHLELPKSPKPSRPTSGQVSPGQLTQGAVTAPSPLTVSTAVPLPPAVIAAVNSATSGPSPSPTKTKKLSLQDYRKRSHKSVDVTAERKEDEAVPAPTPKGNPSSTDSAKQLAFLNVAAPTDATVASQATTVESKIVPGSTWGVR